MERFKFETPANEHTLSNINETSFVLDMSYSPYDEQCGLLHLLLSVQCCLLSCQFSVFSFEFNKGIHVLQKLIM